MRMLSLNTKLVAGCMLMLGFSLVLSISLIAMFGNYYARADRDVVLLATFKRVLVASSRISAERGPMNVVIGEDGSAQGAARRKLDEARQATDDALADILKPSAGGPKLSQDDELVAAVDRVNFALGRARQDADALIARPRTERSAEAIAFVLRGMFDAVDRMRPLSLATMAKITADDPSLAGPALTGLMLTELREYGGRLASLVIPFITAKEPLTDVIQFDVVRTRQRILEIWQLAGRQAGLFADDPALAAARIEVNSAYFGHGIELVDMAIARGRLTGNFGTTTAELTERYVPTLQSIERLGSGFMNAALGRLEQQRSQAFVWVTIVSVVAVLIVLATLALIVAARIYVLRPLMAASDHIVALSHGKSLGELESPTNSSEMLRLFDALEGLRIMLGEREQHTERLKILSETDGLTGLINRRPFDRIGQGGAEFANLSREVNLIMMDLDRFKNTNDTYGHLAGDQLLKHAAAIVQRICRKSDLAARYGGEEIAIVIFEQDPWVAMHVAERIRTELEAEPIVLPDGRRVHATASFGVANGQRGGTDWPALVRSADGALYEAKASGRNRVCRANGLSPLPARSVA